MLTLPASIRVYLAAETVELRNLANYPTTPACTEKRGS